MKKTILILLSICLLLSLAACGAAPAKEPEAKPAEGAAEAPTFTTVEAGKLHMATNAAFPPYEMIGDKDNEYIGIDVDIAKLIAEKLGLELVIDDMDFGAVITSVQQGKSDMAMAGLTVNEERKKNVDFTTSYAKGIQVVIVTEDSDIKSIDDLANNKIIGTQANTTGYFYCSAPVEDGGYGEDMVVAYENGPTAVKALIDGKVDAVVIDNEPAKAFVAQNPGLKILEAKFTEEDYAIGISKDNPELLAAIEAALSELIETGKVKEIVDKYIKAE